jgi:hypothetical protein
MNQQADVEQRTQYADDEIDLRHLFATLEADRFLMKIP